MPPGRNDTKKIYAGNILAFGSTVFLSAIIVWGIILLFNALPENLPHGGSERLRIILPALFLNFLVFSIIALLVKFNNSLNKAARNNFIINIVLLFVVIYLPISILEISLGPFVGNNRATSIFIPDSKRIWKLKPVAEDTWGGVNVRINSHGFRGNEISSQKSKDEPKILYLGDSVTFGYLLENENDCFPNIIESMLEDSLKCNIETINAGIGGYSPWQEKILLEESGLDFDPDLVVLTIVLNDFTQKFSLEEYGGFWKGYQLAMNTSYFVSRLEKRSNIVGFIRKQVINQRYGFDPVHKAELEEIKMSQVLLYNTQPDTVKRAVDTTLEYVLSISDICRNNNIELLVILFPAIYQLMDVVGTKFLDEQLTEFVQEHDIDFISLTPVFDEKLKESNQPFEAFFLDDNHPGRNGNIVAATAITDYICKEELITCPKLRDSK